MSVNVSAIRTDQQLDAAIERLNEVFDAEQGTTEAEEREVLAALIEAYERVHYPVGREIQGDTFAEYVAAWGIKPADVAKCLGSRPRASDVISGKRNLSLGMIHRLHEWFGMPYERLVPVAIAEKAA